MFGRKTKSANDQFIMAAGKAAGNLKEVGKKATTAQPPKKAEKVTATKAQARVSSARQDLGSLGNLKRGLKA